MRVLVAGATGAIGRPLIAQLLAAGHQVVGMTRREERADALRRAGAEAIVCDALDAEAARRAVLDTRPEAIVDQLTSLPEDYDVRRLAKFYADNDRVRREGTAALLAAAKEAGVRRYVVQSIAFLYAPEGGWVKTEDDRPWLDAPPPFTDSVRVLVDNERKVTEAAELEGLALRYGFFYGPGTYYAPGGSIAEQVRKRRFPIVGGGDGVTSYIHLHDAAAATVVAVSRGAPGVYNIVDDEPAPMREWLPAYAAAIGAKPPRRVPGWLARLAAGSFVASMARELRGASNAKARAELGWQPALPSWREGFRTALASDAPTRPAGFEPATSASGGQRSIH
jgi:nucleoside-diphosphate-sugar epimerase